MLSQTSFLRKSLAPLSLIYGGFSALHAQVFLRPRPRNGRAFLPLVVIGALRAGGSGKTAVTLELARRLSRRGRLGILAYRLGPSGGNGEGGLKRLNPDLAEVTAESDWRFCSDEAVLLARESGARVFVTRNRERAWDCLSACGELDFLISDDGLMDPRLRGAFRIALKTPEEKPGVFDLLPAGPYRLTARALPRMDCVAEGPRPGKDPAEFWFRRELIFPEGFDPCQSHWAICGLGNPRNFLEDLRRFGVRVAGASSGRDHGLPKLERTRAQARGRGAEAFVCTSKDWVKLAEQWKERDSLAVISERIEFSPSLVSAVARHLEAHASS